MRSFSLWDEPWIPVIYCSGQATLLSIRDTLVQAKKIREINDSSPLISTAIIRLLQAVLYRVFSLKTFDDWKRLWLNQQFDSENLDNYGVTNSVKFDLLHPEKPFYQVQKIEGDETHPISALVIEAASGNNPTLFDHGLAEGAKCLSLDRAACHLIAYQVFAVGGGKSKPFNRMDGPLTKGLVVQAFGNNLFKTLMLNMSSLQSWKDFVPFREDDCPFWERETFPEPVQAGTIPKGPMDYLTWQSRQVHLCVDESANKVTGCQILQRFALPRDGNRHDPYKPYVDTEEEGWQPVKPNKQRAVWQYSHILLQSNFKPRESNLRALGLTDWVATLRRHGRQLNLPDVIDYTVSCLVMDPQKPAKIEQWRKEQLSFPVEYFGNEKLVLDLDRMFSWVSWYEGLLNQTSLALAIALGEKSKQLIAMTFMRTGSVDKELTKKYRLIATSFGMVSRFWPALEGPFRQLLKDLPDKGYVDVQKNWLSALKETSIRCYSDVRNSLAYEISTFDVLTQIDLAFYGKLAGIQKTLQGGEEKDNGPETNG